MTRFCAGFDFRKNRKPPAAPSAHDPLIRGSAAAIFLALLLPLLAWTAEIPPLKARVTDLTGTLSAQQKGALEQSLAEFETRKGAQIAVLLLPTTQPETIEQYAVRVQESWKLGRKGVDDGVLLVVAKDERKLHIETGYGLEGILPDAVAKRIIEDDIVPRFKQNDYYGGIRAGVDRIMRVVEGEKLPPPIARSAHPQAGSHIGDWIMPVVILVLLAGGILRAIFGRFVGASVVGTLAAVAGWAIIGSLIAALVVGFIGFIFAMLSGATYGGGRSGWSGGGWSGGGFGSGGFSGGGGGFSGGGGSSGGGGASGSW